jgi:DNA polymerase-4
LTAERVVLPRLCSFGITPEMGRTFVEALPVGKFYGIGPATSARMNSLGIHPDLDMRNQSLAFMQANFGNAGPYYYSISRGVDDREVRANRIRKSVGAENTFTSDLTEFDAMVSELQPLIDKVWRHCDDKGSRGRTVTLKLKFNDFEISRSNLERLSIALLQNEMPRSQGGDRGTGRRSAAHGRWCAGSGPSA